MLWWLVLAIPALVFGHGNVVLIIALYGVFVAVAYVISLALHTNRRCRACKGSGRQRGAMFTYGDRACKTCGGQSRHRRWGAQVLYPQSRTYAERSSSKARGRRGATR
jgi:DnaJ-class molecular chaperone